MITFRFGVRVFLIVVFMWSVSCVWVILAIGLPLLMILPSLACAILVARVVYGLDISCPRCGDKKVIFEQGSVPPIEFDVCSRCGYQRRR